MIADNVACADGMHADLFVGRSPINPCAPMRDIAFIIKSAHFAEDLRQTFRGSARRILFQPMMRLDDLEIEPVAEQLRCFACQPEERVHANAEVRREQHRNRFRRFLDRMSFARSNARSCR